VIRQSFLRNVELEQISVEDWDVPAIGTCQIGFSICPESGLVMQSPSPTPNEIQTYYKETATYINPGREGKPSSIKVKGVDRYINIIIDTIGNIPNSVFQVGCSDGYTLKRFSDAGATSVTGIDPSIASHDLAKKKYNIQTTIGTIEDYQIKHKKFDLIILTHVLEHLFDPVQVLRRCNELQNEGDWILIEVPLFERIECFPPGMLTLEHLTYFSEGTLIETVTKPGYEPIYIEKYFGLDAYPLILIAAKKHSGVKNIKRNDYSRARKLLVRYLKKEKQTWKKAEKNIMKKIKRDSPTYIYGAGIHTTQLLAYTNLKEELNIVGLLDSSHTKWGEKIGDLICYNKNEVDFNQDDTIIISSYASEDEIFKSLTRQVNLNVNIIKIYGERQDNNY